MVAVVGDFDKLQAYAMAAKRGDRGLEYGLPPHLMDAATVFNECWQKLEQRAIAGCWITSRCLNNDYLINLNEDYRRYRKTIK